MKKRLHIGWLLVWLMGSVLFVQAQTIEQLNAQVSEASGIEQLRLQNELARRYLKISSGRAITYGFTVVNLADKMKEEIANADIPPFSLRDVMREEADGYNTLGQAHMQLNETRKATRYFREAMRIANQVGYNDGVSLADVNLESMGKSPAIEVKPGKWLKETVESLESIFEPEDGTVAKEISMLPVWVRATKAEEEGNYEQAIKDYEKLAEYYSATTDSTMLNKAYLQLSRIYRAQNKLEIADKYLALAVPNRAPAARRPEPKKEETTPKPVSAPDPEPKIPALAAPAIENTDNAIQALEAHAAKGQLPGLDATIESLKSDRDRYYRLLQERKEDSLSIASALDIKIREIDLLLQEQEMVEAEAERTRKAQNLLIATLSFISIILGLMVYLFISNRSAHRKLKDAFSQLEDTHLQLKNTQTQLVSAEKMASLGQLTAGIAHEINNPINFISGNIHPLRNDVEDLMKVLKAYESSVEENQLNAKFDHVTRLKEELELDYITDEIQELIVGIDEGAHRTTEIIKGLRNFARMDEDERKPYEIHKGIDSTLALLRNQAKKDIEIIKLYGDLPKIPAYPGKINQVFMNILNNGIQAMPDGGILSIQTKDLGDKVAISVKDTGVGMPEEVQKRIFEPFYTTKPVGEGTGLGMSISLGIIEQHEGNIEVESVPGQGTEVTITLPIG